MIIKPRFFDIRFLHWRHMPGCAAWVDKKFDYFVLDFAAGGELEFSMDGAPPVILRGPVVWLTFPGPRFEFGARPSGATRWDHRYVAFDGPFADKLRRGGLFDVSRPVVPIAGNVDFIMAFDALLKYLDNPLWGPDRAACMLEGLLLQLHEQRDRERLESVDNRVSTVAEKIRAAPSKDWNFREEARKARLSFSHFRRLFHDGLGQPPTLFLIGERMKMAASELKSRPGSTLSEIAENCGYKDIYYFNKLFKRFHGVSPGKYRRRLSELG